MEDKCKRLCYSTIFHQVDVCSVCYKCEKISGSARHSQKIVDRFTIIGDIVTIGQSSGLEVEADDIEEFLEDHCIELTTEELEHLQDEQKGNWMIKLKKKQRIKKMSQVIIIIIIMVIFKCYFSGELIALS